VLLVTVKLKNANDLSGIERSLISSISVRILVSSDDTADIRGAMARRILQKEWMEDLLFLLEGFFQQTYIIIKIIVLYSSLELFDNQHRIFAATNTKN